PSASSSSICGPRDGSVTFCVATTPTPERTQAQRAPTAMLEELTAMPRSPVSAQRPTMEKVTFPSSCCRRGPTVRNHRDHVDFHQPFRLSQRRYDQPRGNRIDALEPAPDLAIDR